MVQGALGLEVSRILTRTPLRDVNGPHAPVSGPRPQPASGASASGVVILQLHALGSSLHGIVITKPADRVIVHVPPQRATYKFVVPYH